jgi:PPK2 family polyphosphate:nucleotide phosphotransferase
MKLGRNARETHDFSFFFGADRLDVRSFFQKKQLPWNPMKPKKIARLLDRYRVTNGEKFRLADYKPDDTDCHAIDHDDANKLLADGISRLSALQSRLYARNTWRMLVVLQGMDAGGKDGTIRHVLTGVNPQGVDITPFKQPGPEDLAHDFLWRVHAKIPPAGMIGIFNRSHYEEVMVCRVHPELLTHQHLPADTLPPGEKFWRHRLDDIANFEKYLSRQGVVVVKFYLHLSQEEQKRRLLARIDDHDKNWKFSASDLSERQYWDAHQSAAESAIGGTAAPHAPWYVVPADHKWFLHFVVVEALIAALNPLDLHYPTLSPESQSRLQQARQTLESE